MAQILNIRLNIVIVRSAASRIRPCRCRRQRARLACYTFARERGPSPSRRSCEWQRKSSLDSRTAGTPTADELEQAKGGLVLSQRSLDGARAASATFAVETVQNGSLDRLHRWPESVRAVTGEQVQSAAAKPSTLISS